METENWIYDIHAKVPLDPICQRVERRYSLELPAGMSCEALIYKIGSPLSSKVELLDVEFLPTIDGTYVIDKDRLHREGEEGSYLMHGMPIKGLKKGEQRFVLRNKEIVQDVVANLS